MRKVFLVFILISTSSLFLMSQDNTSEWRFGIRADLNMIKESTLIGLDDQPELITRTKMYNGYLLSPVSLYFPIDYKYEDNIHLQLRPGLLMRGNELTSYVLGMLINYYLIKDMLFLSVGIENYVRMPEVDIGNKSHTSITHWTKITGFNDNELHSALLFGIGLQTSKNINFDVSITRPFTEEYGYYEVVDEKNHFELPDGKYPMKLYWMLRVGINIMIF